MSILYVLIPVTLALVALAGWAFFWAIGAGQFDDLESPGWEVLREEPCAEVSPATARAPRAKDQWEREQRDACAGRDPRLGHAYVHPAQRGREQRDGEQ